jgi:hypothetical protein
MPEFWETSHEKALKHTLFERFFVPASIVKGDGGAVSWFISASCA